MILEREDKGHGEGKRVTPGNISKTVLYGKGVPRLPDTNGGKAGMFAQNVAAVRDIGWEMDGISVANAGIKFR